MITFIRSLVSSRFGGVIALLFVGLIAIGFALGDVTGSSAFGGLGGGNIAKVGDRNITIGEFNQSLDARLRAERRDNPNLDMANFIESGGLDSTLQQLINRYALAAFGEEYGMAVSKRLIDYEILKIPGAKGPDGKYSKLAFEAFLRNVGVSEKAIREDLLQNLFAQQLLPAATKGPKAPASFVLPYASLLLEKRSGQLAIIPSQAFLPEKPASDDALAKYYRDNSTKFTVPERRAVSYVLFDRGIVDGRAKPTDKEIAEYYTENADEFAATETRSVASIVVPTEAAAKAASDRVNDGQSLDQVASDLGLAVTNSSDVTKNAYTTQTSKSVADAVFAASDGKAAKPARTGLGWFVALVKDVKQSAARSLVQATPEISTLLETEKRETVLGDLTSEIEDAFSDGETIADVAKEQGLTVDTTPKLFATGQNAENPNYKPIPEMQVILPAAFQLDEEGGAQLIEIVEGERFAMIAVADFVKAAPPPLAKVRETVMQQWAISQGSIRAKRAAERARKEIASGKSLSAALAALKIKLPPSQKISGTRGELRQAGQSLPPPLLMLFSMKEGTAKTLTAPNQAGWFIVKLDKIVKGDASGQERMLAQSGEEITGLVLQEHAQQLVAAALKNVGVEKNEGAIAAMRKRLTSNDVN